VCDILTAAEREVLSLLANGLRPKVIAERTNRSIFTVQSHIARAIRKLGCQGRMEAIALARRRGMIS
jgi:LuxR family transcriptional regulator, regulator of acetate metabolism